MNEFNNIFGQFHNIKGAETQQDCFTVIAIDGMKHRLGRSLEGYPKFFVHTNISASTVQNVIREILSVE